MPNLLSNLRDLASTGIALLRVAGALHRQARATETASKHLAGISARLNELIKIQESRLKLELLRQGADDEALEEEWARIKQPPAATVGEAAARARDEGEGSLIADTPGVVLEALERVLPGSIEEKELIALMARGGNPAEVADLLAQHGLPGGEFTGALSMKDARDLERELDRQEKDQERLIEKAAKELESRARGLPERPKSGDAVGGASFGGVE